MEKSRKARKQLNENANENGKCLFGLLVLIINICHLYNINIQSKRNQTMPKYIILHSSVIGKILGKKLYGEISMIGAKIV